MLFDGAISRFLNIIDYARKLAKRRSIMNYVVLQIVLKEKLIGQDSRNLDELENAINAQAAKGYRLHTISTANGGSKGPGGGDRLQATLVFEKIETN